MTMQTLKDRYTADLKVLIETGKSFQVGSPEFLISYQVWFTESCRVIGVVIPERLTDFKNLYKVENRAEITDQTYSICDFLAGYSFSPQVASYRVFNHNIPQIVGQKLSQQVAILSAVEKGFSSSLFNIRELLQADIFDSEIDVSKELLTKGFLRAAGTIAGVVLEKHLSIVAQGHSLTVSKVNPTINDFNELLKSSGTITQPDWRFIGYLADLRNLCAHNKTPEPTDTQVDELIQGVEKIVKTIS